MSHDVFREQPTGSPEDHRRNGAIEDETKVDIYDPQNKQRTRRRRMIGFVAAGAATLVAAGSLAFVGLRGGGDVEAKAPPVATAPANPTEQPSAPAANETEPTGEPSNELNLDMKTFPFVVEGKRYEGLTALQADNELRVEDYEGNGGLDASKVVPDFVDRVNKWMRSGADEQTTAGYDSYTSTDGMKTGPQAIAADFYDPAFAETLTTPGSDFAEMMAGVHAGYLDIAEKTKDQPVPYSGKYEVVVSNYVQAGNVIQAQVVWEYDDGGVTSEGSEPQKKLLVFKKAPGSDGRQVWKLDQFKANE